MCMCTCVGVMHVYMSDMYTCVYTCLSVCVCISVCMHIVCGTCTHVVCSYMWGVHVGCICAQVPREGMGLRGSRRGGSIPAAGHQSPIDSAWGLALPDSSHPRSGPLNTRGSNVLSN